MGQIQSLLPFQLPIRSSMADWANLPTELLHLISLLLPSSIDLLRFRSVCATWRAAASPPPSTVARFPIYLPDPGIYEFRWGVYLSKRTIYSLQSSLAYEPPWIIKLERDFPARMHLLDPLVRSQFEPLPGNFPKAFNFLNARVRELGVECILQLINFGPLNLCMEKVAFLNNSDGGFTIFGIDHYGTQLLKSGDEEWERVNDWSPPYDDVIVWEGKFYCVDRTGRLLLVNTVDLNVSVVANSIFGGDKKFLVDLDGELVLADMYLARELNCVAGKRIVIVKFKVFKLDVNAEKWTEVSDLGNRMLFLGDNCTFSASNIEIFGDDRVKGNCIFFTDQYCMGKSDGKRKRRGVGVFDMESGSIGPIGGQVGYSKMFWPPPDWVYSTARV